MIQSAGHVFLVRPSRFGFNEETAASNQFQLKSTRMDIADKALEEFTAFAGRLVREGIEVIITNDQPGRKTPDAVFPNNWISFHHQGKVVLYPMESPSRRRERRPELIDQLAEENDLLVSEIIDLTGNENKNRYLEGTGSVVFDHQYRRAYMARSSRSHPAVLEELCERISYTPVNFDTQMDGMPIYHTNVMMSIGSRFVAISPACIPDVVQRKRVLETLVQSGRRIIDLTLSQVASFAGNMLEVRSKTGDPFIVLSDSALKSLKRDQVRELELCGTLLPCSVPVIEKHGGGSVRCMMAEIFLPQKRNPGSVTIRSPKTAEEWNDYFALRYKILRQPWGQPEGSEKDGDEDRATHFMAITGTGRAVGCGRLQEQDDHTARVRYVAIDDSMQGKGVGKQLMIAIEEAARKMNKKRVFLLARENALPFYLSIGYRVIEETDPLFGVIPHYAMEKEV
jgi:N-acetylglutamate synthase-like GNAT family acetyltransferase